MAREKGPHGKSNKTCEDARIESMGHEKRRDYNDDEVEVEIVRGQEVHGDLSRGGVC